MGSEQSATLNTENGTNVKTSAEYGTDGTGTNRWVQWARNAILERVVKAADAVAASGEYGIPALAVRRDAAAADAGTTGDYSRLAVDALGRLRAVVTLARGGATRIRGASGNVANASAVATLAAGGASVTTYITGFEVTAAGATAGAVVNVTVTGTTGGTLTYVYAIPTGATVAAAPLVVEFPDPIPASAVNTAIAVTLPALGAGNTHAAVVAHGYQQ